MMIAVAVLVALDALSTTAVIVVAALVFSVSAAIITDIMFLKPGKVKAGDCLKRYDEYLGTFLIDSFLLAKMSQRETSPNAHSRL